MMPGLFAIPISGIKAGHHIFEFEINKSFFDLFDESEIKAGELIAVTELVKSNTHLDLVIKIAGKVRVSCDRCLEMFDQTVGSENRLFVKFGNNIEESDPEIVTLAPDENELNLKQYFYEYIHLSLPIRRIHPDDANGKSTCDPVMLQKLKEHLVENEKTDDPRWEELRKLMNNN